MTETNRIEFKRCLTKELDIEKEVIAFLNYREGGILYIGIDNDGTPVGVEDIDGDMLKIKDRLRDNIFPSPMGLFDVTVELINDVHVIRVFVSSGSEKPYYKRQYGLSPKGCYIRVGTAAEPMTQNQIEEMFSHRVRRSLQHIPSPRKDLTFRQLQIYYNSKHLTLNDNFAKNLNLLTDDERYNYVAYLLADENGNSVKLAKYAGIDRYELIENHEYGYCSLLKATDSVLDRLHIENTVKSSIGYPYRTDTPLWDERAVRELVINAIVHNDYFNEVPPKFELFSDRLEITSTGTLPQDMSQDDFFNGVSNPRNRELMRVFRDVELVESLGTGLQRVLKTYSRECFIFMDHFIRVIIPYAWLPYEETSSLQKGLQKGLQNITKALTPAQESILAMVIADPTITTTQMAIALKVSRQTISDHIATLKHLNLLRRKEGRKNGYWEAMRSSEKQ